MAKVKSGLYWVKWADTHAKNSTSLNDLDVVFQAKVRSFIKALEEAGIKVIVSATKRNEKRAYLFHWCWKLAQGKVAATGVPAKIGVDIEWNHGTEAASRLGAAEMVSGLVWPCRRTAQTLQRSRAHISPDRPST